MDEFSGRKEGKMCCNFLPIFVLVANLVAKEHFILGHPFPMFQMSEVFGAVFEMGALI